MRLRFAEEAEEARQAAEEELDHAIDAQRDNGDREEKRLNEQIDGLRESVVELEKIIKSLQK